MLIVAIIVLVLLAVVGGVTTVLRSRQTEEDVGILSRETR